jgi:hypothetical protein
MENASNIEWKIVFAKNLRGGIYDSPQTWLAVSFTHLGRCFSQL